MDGGRRPARAVKGESFQVSATIFREGHGIINAAAVLRDPDRPPRGGLGGIRVSSPRASTASPLAYMRELAPGTDRATRRIAAINWVTVSWVATASSRIVESNARRVLPVNTPVSATTARTASGSTPRASNQAVTCEGIALTPFGVTETFPNVATVPRRAATSRAARRRPSRSC